MLSPWLYAKCILLAPLRPYHTILPAVGALSESGNEGGQFWILGIKTEGPGPVIITRSGGASELFGGLMYSSGGARTQDQPAFIIEDSRASITISEANFSHTAYPVLVRVLHHG